MNRSSERTRLDRERLDGVQSRLKEIDRQIDRLRDERSRLRNDRTRLKQRLSYVNGRRLNGGGDSIYVSTKEVRPVVELHLKGGTQRTIAARTGVCEKTITRILKGNRMDHHSGQFVTLRTADQILSALGQPTEVSEMEWYTRSGSKMTRMER